MRTDLAELRDAIRYGYATRHDLETAKREDVVAIKSDPELVQYRFVAHDEMEKAPEVVDRSVTWRASDETADSHGDIVRVGGWDLDRYHKNGVILWAHERDRIPLAKGKAWKHSAKESSALMVKGDWFEPGVNEFADGVLRVIKAGGLPGASVGFRSGEVNDPSDPKERQALGLGPWGLEFTAGHELLENSVVSVPANPNALQERCVKALDGELERWLRTGEKSASFVQEFRKRFTQSFVEQKRNAMVTVPEMPETDKAAEPDEVEEAPASDEPAVFGAVIEELRGDKSRLARTVDHLLARTAKLEDEAEYLVGQRDQCEREIEQLRAKCAELHLTVDQLQASGAGQSQQPPSASDTCTEAKERGDGAVETSEEPATADERAFGDFLSALQQFTNQQRNKE